MVIYKSSISQFGIHRKASLKEQDFGFEFRKCTLKKRYVCTEKSRLVNECTTGEREKCHQTFLFTESVSMYVVQVLLGQRDATFYKTFLSEYLLTEPFHAYSCQVLNKKTTAHGLNSNYWLKQKWNSKLQPKSDNVRAHERLNYLQNILKLIMLGPTIGYLHQVSLSYFLL